MVIVKLITNRKIEERAFDHNPTVSEFLDLVGENFVEEGVTRKQHFVSKETTLYDGDVIYIGERLKGNLGEPFEISFIKVGAGGRIIKLPAEDGETIKTVLEKLDPPEFEKFYRSNGKPIYEYRVKGQTDPVTDAYVFTRPDDGTSIRVVCSQQLKGNEKK